MREIGRADHQFPLVADCASPGTKRPRPGCSGPDNEAFANQFMNVVMQRLRASHVPDTTHDLHKADIFYEEVRLHSPDDPVRGPYVMPLVTLKTNACRWSTSGGCLMCGYHLGATRGHVEGRHLMSQTHDAIARLNPSVYPALVFTSNGSFLDPFEVSDGVRPVLLRLLRDAGFRFVIAESRPEFVSAERLDAMATAFAPEGATSERYPISISLGLESANDFFRRYCINKGASMSDYLRAFDILERHRLSYDCYVLLGKPFMTAREDVDDAVDTVKVAVEKGAGSVFVMVTNMVSYSLTSYLHEQGRYTLPSLWRAVELLERLPEECRRLVQVKGISHAPVTPQFYARTCVHCTEQVKGALNFWNQTGDFEHIRSIVDCDCRDSFNETEWACTVTEDLPVRVLAEYRRLADELGIDPALIPELGSADCVARQRTVQ